MFGRYGILIFYFVLFRGFLLCVKEWVFYLIDQVDRNIYYSVDFTRNCRNARSSLLRFPRTKYEGVVSYKMIAWSGA